MTITDQVTRKFPESLKLSSLSPRDLGFKKNKYNSISQMLLKASSRQGPRTCRLLVGEVGYTYPLQGLRRDFSRLEGSQGS